MKDKTKTLDFSEIKKLEFNILYLFANYCELHGLKYYLYAGTLLGAVRHKGFIPWDDDIDVVMPRPDYERFFELVQKEPIDKTLDLISHRYSDNCICPFFKLVDNRTDGYEENMADYIHNGVWIDIFPLDGLPEDSKKMKSHIAILQFKLKLISLSIRSFVPCRNPLRFFKRLFIFVLFSRINTRKIAYSLEEIAQRYDYSKSSRIGVTVFGRGFNNVIEKDGFETSVKLKFESLEFDAPGTYKKYLENLYGDYMTPPPPKDQINRHKYTCWWRDGFEPDEEQK